MSSFKERSRTLLFVTLGLSLILTTAAADTLPSAERFDIDAQPISAALRDYAQQTGEQVVFYSEIGKGRESTRVEGEYTRDEALRTLLKDTGLTFQRLNPRTIAIGSEQASGAAQYDRTAQAAPLMRLAQNDTSGMLIASAQDTPQQSGATAQTPQPESDEQLFEMGEVV